MNLLKYFVISIAYWCIFYYIPNTNGILLPIFILFGYFLYQVDARIIHKQINELKQIESEDVANHVATILTIIIGCLLIYVAGQMTHGSVFAGDDKTFLSIFLCGCLVLCICALGIAAIAFIYYLVFDSIKDSVFSKFIQGKIKKS